jgi:hypothetical protein
METFIMTTRDLPVRPTKKGGLAIRSPENVLGGLVLIALALFALWLTLDLPRGTLTTVGPAMLPQAIAVLIAVCGFVLLIAGFKRRSEHGVPVWSLRGPFLVSISIALFAVTIKEHHFGNWRTIEFGLMFAGPMAIIIGGYASSEARFRDLLLLALTLTPFCMLLFGDMLNLPIPILPRFLSEALFGGMSYKSSLRVTAAVLFTAAILVFRFTKGRSGPRIEVAKHEVRN